MREIIWVVRRFHTKTRREGTNRPPYEPRLPLRINPCNLCNLRMKLITHPDKLLFPEDGITKAELAAHYEAIAPVMLPHLRRRPITMERDHRGIHAPGFFQKDVSKGFPEWLKRVEVPKKDGLVHHPIAIDTRSLLWIAN